MIRKLLATTAIATLVSSGVYAQTTTQPADTTAPAATDQAPAADDDAAKTNDAAATDDATKTNDAAATNDNSAATSSSTAASDTAAPADGAVQEAAVVPDGNLASKLIGETVYNGTGDDADNIGDVNDLVIDGEGKVQAIVIGVGGFLGIGEKHVAIDYSTIDWAERDGDRWIVVAATEDQLKELPSFDKSQYEPAPATAANDSGSTGTGGAMAPSTTAQAPANDASGNMAAAPANDAADKPANDTAAAPADNSANDTAAATDNAAEKADDAAAAPADDASKDTAAAADNDANETVAADDAKNDAAAQDTDDTATAAIDRSTLKEMNTADISAEKFVGTTVYGADEENIGEIGDVILSQDGKVDAVILDVGGFLGVGEKKVAVGMDNLQFMADEDGDQYLYTTFTKEQLDAAPAYDESTYAEKRDEQRIIMEN